MFERWAADVGAYATIRTMNACEADFEFLSESPPFSKGEIDRLGQFYAGRRAEPPDMAAEVLEWYALLAHRCEAEIRALLACEFNGQVDFAPRVTRRIKSQHTAAAKVRDKNIQLSRMQDFAGIRFTFDLPLRDLQSAVHLITTSLQKLGIDAETREYLETSQQGYRAIHLWIDAPAGRVEVQFRTALQDAWANTFEKLADLTGRRIRYDEGYQPLDPYLAELNSKMQALSKEIYRSEVEYHGAENVERRLALMDQLRSLSAELARYRPESHASKGDVSR